MFPIIAELFEVDIGVLFGQNKKEIENINQGNERKFVFEPLHRVEFLVSNECNIRVIKRDDEKSHLEVMGDDSFIEFLGIENDNGILRINVKNPTGSDTKWLPYNRGNYNKRNSITLYTGKNIANYLLSIISI